MATYVARMEVLRPEVMRVTRAHKALGRCGRALRSWTDDNYFFGESFASAKISCFWSHSWHGRRWMKIFSLMLRYNGLPSAIIGSFTALTMIVLFSCGLLPGLSRLDDNDPRWSTWSLAGGFAGAVITFFLWRPRQLVFLDRVCISANNVGLKAASIFSLAGILKKSDQMLVLWDPTWSDRLWCVFELAAFLKSKATSEQVIIILPTFLGPCSIGLFIGVFLVMLPATTVPMREHTSWGRYFILVPLSGTFLLLFISGYVIAAAFRAYFRSVEKLKKDLSEISFDETRCSCCDCGHVQRGAHMMCDREIVKECVSIWFGSEEAFEDYVRSEVLVTIVAGLHDRTFTRGWSLSVASPILWAFLDIAASHAGYDNASLDLAIAEGREGMVLWFCCAPMFVDICIFFACRYCQEGNSTCHEILKNLQLEMVAVVVFSVMAATFVYSHAYSGPERLHSAAQFVGGWSIMALFHVFFRVSRQSGACHLFRLRSG